MLKSPREGASPPIANGPRGVPSSLSTNIRHIPLLSSLPTPQHRPASHRAKHNLNSHRHTSIHTHIHTSHHTSFFSFMHPYCLPVAVCAGAVHSLMYYTQHHQSPVCSQCCMYVVYVAYCGQWCGVRASYTSSVRGSYGAERSSQLYEARTELRTSLVLAYELRTSLVSVYELRTSLVYDLLLVYESYTRLVRPPVYAGSCGCA